MTVRRKVAVMMTKWRRVTGRLREGANRRVRRAAGLAQGPPPRCDDPRESYCDVTGVARLVHGDLASMLIGGLGSLFFQMLHPYAMAGVAQHSRYQDDPLGRLLQTANFISATTYGSTTVANRAIAKVQNVHQHIHGVADDGVAYDANDPHLLLWVHCAEIAMFLGGYRRFGQQRLSDDDADRYVSEMARVARDFGVTDPPRDVRELRDTLASFRPELRLSADAAVARDFIIHGVMTNWLQRLAFRFLVRSAWTLLDPWAYELLGVKSSALGDRVVVLPVTRVLCRLIRAAVPPVTPHVASVNPPSTTTT